MRPYHGPAMTLTRPKNPKQEYLNCIRWQDKMLDIMARNIVFTAFEDYIEDEPGSADVIPFRHPEAPE